MGCKVRYCDSVERNGKKMGWLDGGGDGVMGKSKGLKIRAVRLVIGMALKGMDKKMGRLDKGDGVVEE